MKILPYILAIGFVASCEPRQQAPELPVKQEPGFVYATRYTVIGSPFRHDVEKFVVDGHEYLVFSAKVANPPTVIHSESCPCKND